MAAEYARLQDSYRREAGRRRLAPDDDWADIWEYLAGGRTQAPDPDEPLDTSFAVQALGARSSEAQAPPAVATPQVPAPPLDVRVLELELQMNEAEMGSDEEVDHSYTQNQLRVSEMQG